MNSMFFDIFAGLYFWLCSRSEAVSFSVPDRYGFAWIKTAFIPASWQKAGFDVPLPPSLIPTMTVH